MGTRGTVKVFSNGKPLVCIYAQSDAYFDYLGVKLFEFTSSKEFVNGMSGNRQTVFNGIECFAAQLVAGLKTQAGMYYLNSVDSKDEEFNYEIHGGFDDDYKPLPLIFKVRWHDESFEGSLQEFGELVTKEDEDED